MSAETVKDCLGCKYFGEALDPFIQQVYMGQCQYKEWPFFLNIPKEGPVDKCKDQKAKGK